MRERVVCPKCESESAWYETDHQDTWLRCLCGYCKVVASTLQNSIVIEHPDSEVSLPRRGSDLYRCLAALVGLREATTREIADIVNEGVPAEAQQKSGDVATRLTVLRYKSLVRVIDERKGISGGSTWVATDATLRLFGKLVE